MLKYFQMFLCYQAALAHKLLVPGRINDLKFKSSKLAKSQLHNFEVSRRRAIQFSFDLKNLGCKVVKEEPRLKRSTFDNTSEATQTLASFFH